MIGCPVDRFASCFQTYIDAIRQWWRSISTNIFQTVSYEAVPTEEMRSSHNSPSVNQSSEMGKLKDGPPPTLDV